ncbi:MAG: hypothetical protein KAS38_01655 [Anaerolineales bacterium]|nr:hypothetical protein [Anaerolineales bacterium]
MRSKKYHGLGVLFALLTALLIGAPANAQIESNLYIYGQLVTPDTISGPTNVTISGSIMNEDVSPIYLKHFWITLSNKSGAIQLYNTTYDRVDLYPDTSKSEFLTVLIDDLAVGNYDVFLSFGYTTPSNSTEVDLLPDSNMTLAIIEPPGGQPRLLLIFFAGTAIFIVSIFIIGIVGTNLDRKRRRKG